MANPDPLARLSVVLVHPKEPGNIGAAARAMKTMGLSRLVLVAGADPDAPEARRMGHGAHELLSGARRCATLAEALADCRMALATTHRRRRGAPPLLPVETAIPALAAAALRTPVALVFGREDRGLTAEELTHCTGLCRLPAAAPHPSLNLAQAVMVFGWEIARAVRAARRADSGPSQPSRAAARAPSRADRTALLEEWRQRLAGSGLGVGEAGRLTAALRRLLEHPDRSPAELSALRRLVRAVAAPPRPDQGR